ncbi:DUF5123 domain-containing protein [Muriicola sp. Z0-33]|uniref:DUF5123 domain-containing protein n=1 Tax=Muriicola sp. Z0-33 TaxID=2816957 RepID=UPI002237974F|nr:DUF5123 domain-containing protein [Muriicola sp. Z0-33]MCW5515263.1 hypothetical protein [Muriicola sp. Z0-33]
MKELLITLIFAINGFVDTQFIDYDTYLNKIINKDHYSCYISKQQWDVLNFEEKKNLYSQTYFVSALGNSANNGLSEQNPWSLAHAMSNAAPGDIFYVRAGNYGAVQQSMYQDGVEGNPISFIGYKNKPGDIVARGGNSLQQGGKNAIDPSEMPAIIGTITDSRPNEENGLQFHVDYLVLRNFQFYGYFRPIQVRGHNAVVDNIYSSTSGTHNPSDLKNFSPSFPNGAYSGWGLILEGDYIKFSNCFILDAGAEGIKLIKSLNPRGYDNTVYTQKGVGPYTAHTKADGNGTDYAFLVSSNTEGGIFKNTKVIRSEGNVSPGHGIVVKPNEGKPATNHLFDGFYVRNSKIETQFPDCTYITFKNGILEDTDFDQRSEVHEANIANGSRYVTIENTVFINTRVVSKGWNEHIYSDSYTSAAVDAKIRNCLFINKGSPYSPLAIGYSFPGELYETKNLTIDHCTFAGGWSRLWEVDKPNKGVVFKNSIVDGIGAKYLAVYHDGPGKRGGTSGPFELNIEYSFSNFSNGFAVPEGTSNTGYFPGFKDPENDDYSLTSDSPMKGMAEDGKDLGYLVNFVPSP